jgi:hypothetical protein
MKVEDIKEEVVKAVKEKYNAEIHWETERLFCDLAVICEEDTRKRGIINKDGELVAPIIFDGMTPVLRKNGHSPDCVVGIAVILQISDKYEKGKKISDGKEAMITADGVLVIPPIYDVVGLFEKEDVYRPGETHDNNVEEFLSLVRLDGKLGFLDKTGKVVIPVIYDEVYGFQQGLLYVKLNDKCGFVDRHNNVVIPIIYDHIMTWPGPFCGGLAVVTLNGKRGLINEKGEEVTPCKYALLEIMDNVGGYYRFQDAETLKKGLMFHGKELTPAKWDDIGRVGECTDGRRIARVELDEKYGFIDVDKNGQEILPVIYDDIKLGDNYNFEVTINDETYLVDMSGNKIEK